MKIEELKEKREYFAWRAKNFEETSFPTMAADFGSMVQIIDELIAAVQTKDSVAESAQEGENNATM